MPLEIRGIFIEKRPERAAFLKERLESVLLFSDHIVVRSPREGLEVIAEQFFEVCFISSEFDRDDVNAFIQDVGRLNHASPVILMQVRDALGMTEDRAQLAGNRFAAVLTRLITPDDIHALVSALQPLLRNKEVKQRSQESYAMIDLVLREIDRVSKDIKRGKKRKLTRGTFGALMKANMEFSPIVQEGYFSELEKRVEQSLPAKNLSIKIPERLLKLGLPGLSNGTYQGQSLRVWEMLEKKFGREE